MVTKEITYRGQALEELKKLDVREFSKYLKSRPRRAVLRQYNEIEKFINNCKEKISNNKQIKTHSREIVVVPQMIGMKIWVHSGKAFFPVEIIGEMLGHRLGEFALTRSKVKHGAAGLGATKGSKFKGKK